MNKRIRELADQARQYARDYVADCKHYGYYMEHNELEVKFEEKFAELIVGECAGIANKAEPYQSSDLIRKHFGVEE
jgi:hypothetical protein